MVQSQMKIQATSIILSRLWQKLGYNILLKETILYPLCCLDSTVVVSGVTAKRPINIFHVPE